MIPISTRNVIANSQFRLTGDCYFFVDAVTINTPERHLLICRDDKETTVVTTASGLDDLVIRSQNQDKWRLIIIECAHPFYCVGFLQSISTAMTGAGLDILLVSTFSRDLVFVKQGQELRAAQVLQQAGFVAEPAQNL